MRRFFPALVLLLATSAPPAQAAMTIGTLYNTGVGDGGQLLTSGPDPHYVITRVDRPDPAYNYYANPSVPPGTYSNYITFDPPVQANLVTSPHSAWVPNGAANTNSLWISRNAGTGSSSYNQGVYTYQTTFDLTGLEPGTVQITGTWGSDDAAWVYLNLADPNVPDPAHLVAYPGGFSTLTALSISGQNGLFLPGLNTLTFKVWDGGNAVTGLRMNIASATAEAAGGPVAVTGGPYWTGPGSQGYTVTFDASGSYHAEDPDKWLVAWDWELDGDGLFDDATGEVVTLSAPEAGTYTVSLRVTDNVGDSRTANTYHRVAGTPVAAITSPANNTARFYGEGLSFAGSTPDHPLSYQWTSSLDGLLSTARTFSTSALTLGTHVITYRVTDTLGRWSEASINVVVNPQSARVDLALEWGDISFWQNGQEVTNPGVSDPVTVRVRVHNLSSEGTSNAHYLYLYDTYTSGATPSERYLATLNFPAIAPGGTATAEYVWAPNPSLPEPGYHLVRINIPGVYSENFTPNNQATHFVVRGDHQAAGNMEVQVLQLNVSDMSWKYVGDRFTLQGYAQYRWQNGYTLPVLGGHVTIRLGDQTWETTTANNGWFTQSVTMPLATGFWPLTVEVTDSTISGSASLTLEARSLPGPDLTVHQIWLASGVAEMPETVYAYVVNRGGLPVSGAFSQCLEVTNPATGQPLYTLSEVYANTGGLAAGAGVTIALPAVPDDTRWVPPAAGNYQVKVTADCTGAIVESLETNNALTSTLYVYPRHVDLEVAELRKSCQRVRARVVNRGGLNSTGGSLQCADNAGVYRTDPLPPIPGKGGWTWIECGADYAGTAANTRITASIDSAEDAIGTNNSLSAVFDFTPVVDFTVSDIWVNGHRWSPNTAYLSLDNTLQAEIVNVGCNAADGTVQFFVDGVAVGLSAAVPLLNGGASATVSATFDFVGYTAGTNYQLAATVSTAPADSLPGNNTRLEQLTLSPQLPDYEVTSADIDFSVDPGHPARNEKFVISAEISNVGLAAGTDFQVAFYEEGQVLIGEVQTFSLSPGIAPGGSLTVNPRDAHGDIVEWGHGFSGNHAILVTVAPLAGIQDDPNDGNNSATRKVWVNFPPQAQVAVAGRSTTSRPDDTVTWSAAGSNDDLDLDGLGGIVSYQWDFGDGQTATTLVPSATHFYAAPGSYAATVTVTDNNGEGTVATASAGVPYEVTAAAGANGAIAPAGAITIAPGASQTYAITPDPCYHVADVVVDGVSVGPASSYSFDQVSADHTISVSFALTTYTITAGAGPGGSIGPAGAVVVGCGDTSSFAVSPDAGYHVADVLVDGVSVGPVTGYAFDQVGADHTISASFAINVYTITAVAGPNGAVDPLGSTGVEHGSDLTVTISPDPGYHVADVLVDGASVGAIASYQFLDVAADHTISASFAINVYTVTAGAGPGGSIDPSGTLSAPHGSSLSFTLAPAAGHYLASFLVDGNPVVPPPLGYTLTDITSDHTVAAAFAADPKAGFTASPTRGYRDLAVAFTNTSTGAGSYAWTFGDGAAGTDASPTHLYANPGIYGVSLTASGPAWAPSSTLTVPDAICVGYIFSDGPDTAGSAPFSRSYYLGQRLYARVWALQSDVNFTQLRTAVLKVTDGAGVVAQSNLAHLGNGVFSGELTLAGLGAGPAAATFTITDRARKVFTATESVLLNVDTSPATPTGVAAAAGNAQVTLSWEDMSAVQPATTGYRVYRDAAGAKTLLAALGLQTTFGDPGLTNGVQYCYSVTSVAGGVESAHSAVVCATPQAMLASHVVSVETGMYSKGKWVATAAFTKGQKIVLRATVVDAASGTPLAGATVSFSVSGASSMSLVSVASNAAGQAEATWATSIKSVAGSYAAAVSGVSAGGFVWDGIAPAPSAFTLQ